MGQQNYDDLNDLNLDVPYAMQVCKTHCQYYHQGVRYLMLQTHCLALQIQQFLGKHIQLISENKLSHQSVRRTAKSLSRCIINQLYQIHREIL